MNGWALLSSHKALFTKASRGQDLAPVSTLVLEEQHKIQTCMSSALLASRPCIAFCPPYVSSVHPQLRYLSRVQEPPRLAECISTSTFGLWASWRHERFCGSCFWGHRGPSPLLRGTSKGSVFSVSLERLFLSMPSTSDVGWLHRNLSTWDSCVLACKQNTAHISAFLTASLTELGLLYPTWQVSEFQTFAVHEEISRPSWIPAPQNDKEYTLTSFEIVLKKIL